MKIKKLTLWKSISAILAVLLIVSIYTGGFNRGSADAGPKDVPGADEIDDSEPVDLETEGLSAILLNDKRCTTCDTTNLETQLKTTFPEIEIIKLDYSSKQGKEIYDEAGIEMLPVVLFTDEVEDSDGYTDVQNFLDPVEGDYFSLRIGSNFNPNAEICDNELDDNGDGNIDCDDETCKGEFACMEKLETPTVEAFVMSHCPYGTQIEKGLLPVVELLGDKIDFEVKFCDYAMHGEKEVLEQLQQYCIQEEQNDVFIDYLTCFLEAGDGEGCLDTANVDKTKLATCTSATDAKFKLTEALEDKTMWKGNFPPFTIYQEEVDKYSVGGSPTLVINGVTASSSRDPSSLLRTICTGFDEKPEECDEVLSTASPSAGFGFEATGAATAATCG